jgi:hypothetical protein
MLEPGGGVDPTQRSSAERGSNRRGASGRSHLDDEPPRDYPRDSSRRRGSASATAHDDAGASPTGTRLLKVELARSLASARWHTLLRATHLASLNPLVMLVALICVLALGAGMVVPLVDEISARSGGIWFRASCEVESYVYVVKTHHVGVSINIDSAVHRGGTARIFFCAYNMTVTLADGCDGRVQHMPDDYEEERMAHAVFEHGYFIVDIDHDTELEGDVYLEDDDPAAALAPAAVARPAAGAHRLAAAAANASDTDAALQAQLAAALACTARESNLDHLRGSHVAASTLVLSNGDLCAAPFNSTLEEGAEYCDKTAALWTRARPALGSSVECWAFERRVRRGHAHEVRIVLSRTVSNSLLAYCLYAICAALLAVRVVYLFVRRWLQLRGHIEPDDKLMPPLEHPWVADGQSVRGQLRRSAGRSGGSSRQPPEPSAERAERPRRSDATNIPLV